MNCATCDHPRYNHDFGGGRCLAGCSCQRYAPPTDVITPYQQVYYERFGVYPRSQPTSALP